MTVIHFSFWHDYLILFRHGIEYVLRRTRNLVAGINLNYHILISSDLKNLRKVGRFLKIILQNILQDYLLYEMT